MPPLQYLLAGGPAERMGWNGAHGVKLPFDAIIDPSRWAKMHNTPAILPTTGWPQGTELSTEPDWSWRLEVMRDHRPANDLPFGGPDIPDLPRLEASAPVVFAALAVRHQQVAGAQEPVRTVVFGNNVGLVAFGTDAAGFTVTHSLMSGAKDGSAGEFTRHAVPFAPVPGPVPPRVRI
jgi:hypothetical protein